MLVAAWQRFIGANSKLNPRLLPDGIGVMATNLRPGLGQLVGWGSPDVVVTTGGATPLISAYRMGQSSISDTADWLQWTGDVDVVRSLIGNDTTEEIYYTDGTLPKLTNNVLALPGAPGPAAYRTLGIPKPASTITAAVLVAGTGANENRVYVDTYLNNQGRESAPNVASVTIVVPGGSTVTVGNLDVTTYSGHPDITLRRVYCSTNGAAFQRVIEQAVATTTAVDALARGAVMPSGGDISKPAWEQPPANMIGLIPLWNGMFGGFVGKTYCISYPGKPWAWPVEYQDTIPDDIVGTGVYEGNWILLTTAQPYIVTGSSPLMNWQPSKVMQSCLSKRSAVSMEGGVAWAGQNGLCFIGGGPARVVTEGLLTPEQWQALVPSTIIGGKYQNFYIGFYNDGASKAFMIDPLEPTSMIWLTQGARGVYFDRYSERLYMQDVGNTIRRFNKGSPVATTFKTGIARSRVFTNPGCMMVVGDAPSVAITLWANVMQADRSSAWQVVFAATVATGESVWLPGGYLAQEFQLQAVTTAPISAIYLAEAPEDLP